VDARKLNSTLNRLIMNTNKSKSNAIKENIALVGSFASIFAFLFSYTSLYRFITSKSYSESPSDLVIIDDKIYLGVALIACVLYLILSTWAIISITQVTIHLFRRLGIKSDKRIWEASPISYIIGGILLCLDVGLLLIFFTIFLNEISLMFAGIASVLILILTSYFYIEWIRKYYYRSWS
jgi:hypothetical protein